MTIKNARTVKSLGRVRIADDVTLVVKRWRSYSVKFKKVFSKG